MDNLGPHLKATMRRPLLLRVDVAYPNGRETRYPRVPLWTYGLMWIWSLGRKGRVIDYLQRLAPILEPVTLHRGLTAAEIRARDLRSDPGDLSGWAESLTTKGGP